MSDRLQGDDVFVVLVGGSPGEEEAYRDWFAGRHLEDMRALPGVASAHAFTIAQATHHKPSDLCALYEFVDGPAALQAIAQSKGTAALPESENQGAMTWRLYETVATTPHRTLPARENTVIAFIEIPRDAVEFADLARLADAFLEAGAAYVRTLRLSAIQPRRGSDSGVAAIVTTQGPSLDASVATRVIGELLPGRAVNALALRPL